MQLVDIIFNIRNCNAADSADCISEIFINDTLINSDCLKNLGSLIRLDGGNTHLGSNFYNSM